jgi:hypothetical protein
MAYPWRTHGVPMAPHGASWRLMVAHGASWRLMAPHGGSWRLMANPWCLMAPHGTPMANPWCLMAPLMAYPWCTHSASWSTHGVPIAPHGASWRLMAYPWRTHCTSWRLMAYPWRNHGASWRNHGASWRTHGASWRTHGASWRTHGASWRTHGASWRLMAHPWRTHGASWCHDPLGIGCFPMGTSTIPEEIQRDSGSSTNQTHEPRDQPGTHVPPACQAFVSQPRPRQAGASPLKGDASVRRGWEGCTPCETAEGTPVERWNVSSAVFLKCTVIFFGLVNVG